MTHTLSFELGTAEDLAWAQSTVAMHHYLRRPVDPRARPMAYIIRRAACNVGTVTVGIPHATKCRGWWGYSGTPTQWQVVDLARIWLSPELQAGGRWCEPGQVPGYVDRRGVWRPTVATWAIAEVLARVQRDRVALWPPVYPHEPYHILLAVSYHDPAYHRGTIYRHAGALPMVVDSGGAPIPNSSGKYGWAWPLPVPSWSWTDLTDIHPRTLRLF